jgi:hypothetical protein
MMKVVAELKIFLDRIFSRVALASATPTLQHHLPRQTHVSQSAIASTTVTLTQTKIASTDC